ncbi:MAG: DUF1624 domain-containing protein, partial [Gemmatimonadales bacterium]
MSATAVAGEGAVALPSAQPSGRVRLDSIDLLRGLVMVIMAMDHARDYFTDVRFDPTDLSQTSAALFLTRWITHFCAPAFVFLAGTSAFLSQSRGKSREELARFLVTRGLWLVVLEFTVVRLAWTFDPFYSQLLFVQVIWALGVSMIALAGLIHLPLPVVAAVGVAMIAGHNLLDPVRPETLGGWGALWTVLHIQAPITLGGRVLFVGYPLIPWIGVMAAGYAFGALIVRPAEQRRRNLLLLGGGATVAFIALRALNAYGDPSHWSPQASPLFTLLSFLNTTKYPPSLLFLLMTLGPAIVSLVLFERLSGPVARFFIVYGRVPLFYYILHLFLIHGLAVLVAELTGFGARSLMTMWLSLPATWGFGLPVVYLVWAVVVLALYPLCRWFAGV